MKKFRQKFGKKRESSSDVASADSGSLAGSVVGVTNGIKIKDLPKLHRAALEGDLGKVKQLAKKDASPLDKLNRTPLHLACMKGNREIIQELLEWKAKVNVGDSEGQTPLMRCVQCGQEDCVKLLLEEKADVFVIDKVGNTALHYASTGRHLDIMQLLIGSKCNVDATDQEGRSALHNAIVDKFSDVCQCLLQGGADINLPEFSGRTPLMLAASDGNMEMIRFLLENGADPSLKDHKGWTAEDIALMQGHHVAAEHLGTSTTARTETNDYDNLFTGEPKPQQLQPVLVSSRSDNKDSSRRDNEDSWADTDSEWAPVQNKSSKKLIVPKLDLDVNEDSESQSSLVKEELKEDVTDVARGALEANGAAPDQKVFTDNPHSAGAGEKEQPELPGDTKTKIVSPLVKTPSRGDDEDTVSSASQSSSHAPKKKVYRIRDNSDSSSKKNPRDTSSGVPKAEDSDWDSDISSIDHSLPIETPKDKPGPHPGGVDAEKVLTSKELNETNSKQETPKAATEIKLETRMDNVQIVESETKASSASVESLSHEKVTSTFTSTVSESQKFSQPPSKTAPKEGTAEQLQVTQLSSVQRRSSGDSTTSRDSGISQPQNTKKDASPVFVERTSPTRLNLLRQQAQAAENSRKVAEQKLQQQIATSAKRVDLQMAGGDGTENPTMAGSGTGEKGANLGDQTPVQSPVLVGKVSGNPGNEGDGVQRENLEKILEQRVSLQERREKAETGLADARRGRLGSLDSGSAESESFDFMATPKAVSSEYATLANTNIHVAEDALSYTDTEQDASLHEHPILSADKREKVIASALLNESANAIKAQDSIRELRTLLEKEKGARQSFERRYKLIEKERAELLKRVEALSEAKSSLEVKKIELEGSVKQLEYALAEEKERCKSNDALYSKAKLQLNKKEDMLTREMEEKQRVILEAQAQKLEFKSLNATIKQLETERDDLQRKFAQERKSWLLQQQIAEQEQKASGLLSVVTAPVQKETTLLPVKGKMVPQDVESMLEVAQDNRKILKQEIDTLKAELYASRLELDRQTQKYNDERATLAQDVEELHSRVEELKNDVKLNEDALSQATLQYNMQLNALHTEKVNATSNLEKERAAHERLELEVETLKNRINNSVVELDRCQSAKTDLDKQLQRGRNEWIRGKEQQEQELARVKENGQGLTQRLAVAEAKVNALENELHVANTAMTERSALFSTIQRDADARKTAADEAERALQKEKEMNARLQTKIEALQDKVHSLQNDTLRQQLTEKQSKGDQSSIPLQHLLPMQQAQQPVQQSNTSMEVLFTSFKADLDKSRSLLEERNQTLQSTLAHVQADLRASETRKHEIEKELHQIQAQLNSSEKKLASAEVTAEVAKERKENLDRERLNWQSKAEELERKIKQHETSVVEQQTRIAELGEKLEKSEASQRNLSQELAATNSSSELANKAKVELEGELESLKTKQQQTDTELEQTTAKAQEQQNQLSEIANAKADLEHKVLALKDNNTTLELKLKDEQNSRLLLEDELNGSKGLLGMELKTKSKWGNKMAKLEQDKHEALSKAAEERLKARKATEAKRQAEDKQLAELERNTQLTKEILSLKAFLKSAKRKMQEAGASESRITELNADFGRERLAMEETLRAVKQQLDAVSAQLHDEVSAKEDALSRNRLLEQQLNASKTLEKSLYQAERVKNELEDELERYKARIHANYVEKSELDRVKRDVEQTYRKDLNSKLDQVNTYLASQASKQHEVEWQRSSADSALRSEFERSRERLLDELNSLKSAYQDLASEKESQAAELRRMREIYEAGSKMREKLTEQFQRSRDSLILNTSSKLQSPLNL